MAESMNKSRILCFGEVLWDALPSGLFLGGAPLNVCYHLNQLGIKAEMCSKIGDDRLGKEAVRRIKQKGISAEHIQLDDKRETGFVEVEISADGQPAYEIIEPAAWDYIGMTPSLEKLAGESWGLVFGTLAQRNEISRKTIQRLWQFNCQKMIDLNLRPPYDDKEIVYDSLKAADLVKMNDEELRRMKEWFLLSNEDKQAVEVLARKFNCPQVCITKGADGAILYQDGNWYEHKGYPAKTQDSVGAGDAFFAALIYGFQHDKKGEELLKYANAAGSLVAQKNGALPEYEIDSIEKIMTL